MGLMARGDSSAYFIRVSEDQENQFLSSVKMSRMTLLSIRIGVAILLPCQSKDLICGHLNATLSTKELYELYSTGFIPLGGQGFPKDGGPIFNFKLNLRVGK